MEERKSPKVIVPVYVLFDTEGKLTPMCFVW